jgi:hypothetical protein
MIIAESMGLKFFCGVGLGLDMLKVSISNIIVYLNLLIVMKFTSWPYLVSRRVDSKGISPHRSQVRDLVGANFPLGPHPLVLKANDLP